MRKRGDIYEATNRQRDAGQHYIIYFEGQDEMSFIGCMVTHTANEKNARMEQVHIKETAEDGTRYLFQFDNTNLVIARLYKFEAWGPFTKIGELTRDGISFVEETIKDCPCETWDQYLYRTK